MEGITYITKPASPISPTFHAEMLKWSIGLEEHEMAVEFAGQQPTAPELIDSMTRRGMLTGEVNFSHGNVFGGRIFHLEDTQTTDLSAPFRRYMRLRELALLWGINRCHKVCDVDGLVEELQVIWTFWRTGKPQGVVADELRSYQAAIDAGNLVGYADVEVKVADVGLSKLVIHRPWAKDARLPLTRNGQPWDGRFALAS